MATTISCVLILIIFGKEVAADARHSGVVRSGGETGTGFAKNFSRELPCPDAADISPCICSVNNSTFSMTMDCSSVTSEDELRNIFNQTIPFKDFWKLIINFNNNLTTLRENDLGEVTFQIIEIINTNIQVVEANAFAGSKSTISELYLFRNKISSFPFEELLQYRSLSIIDLYSNHLEKFPNISSNTLLVLDLSYNQITTIASSALDNLPNLSALNLAGNPLHEIFPGTFNRSQYLSLLNLQSCGLSYIPDDAIEFPIYEASLVLDVNNISDVAVGAIKGNVNLLYIRENNISELKEEVWRPLVESAALVAASGNPFLCGCEIAWLILNPQLLEKFSGGESCYDGQLLTELDPAIYEELC